MSTTTTTTAVSTAATAAALLLLLRWAVVRILPTPSLSSSTATAKHKIYLGSTSHARIDPQSHRFSYPVFYFGLDLDSIARDTPRGVLFASEKRAVFSVYSEDYLGPVPGRSLGSDVATSIKQKVLDHLDNLGIPGTEIGHVELVTMPRFLGFKSFNPLNTYYCFERHDKPNNNETPKLRATLLEVNNTFGERHVYVCDERNRAETTRKGYTSSHTLPRSFHVSPFNNRTGIYSAHVLNPLATTPSRMDVVLVLQNYKPDSAEHPAAAGPHATTAKRFMAEVHGDAYPLTAATLAHLLLLHPVTAFLTLPRIMYEAWRIAYRRGLKVYQRPGPYRPTWAVETAKGAGKAKTGMTIGWKKWDWFQKFSHDLALRHLQAQVTLHRNSLVLHFPDGTTTTLHPASSPAAEAPTAATAAEPPASDPAAPISDPTAIHLHVHGPNLFLRLATDAFDTGRALSTTYARGEWDVPTPSHLDAFLRLMTSPAAPAAPVPTRPSWSTATLRSLCAAYNADTRNGPTRSPFRSVRWSPVPAATGAGGWTCCAGVAAVWAEEAWFGAITEFVRNPYAVAGRVDGYVRDGRGRVDEKCGEMVEGGVEGLVAEWADEVEGVERERRRTWVFWEAFGKVVGEVLHF
ncbi:hypothetical protein HDU96_009691 [Phlyctochytrium bullatum]|nr:hypothetical protein HDU96_009691 [Phlyctochytrium bullatum]